MDSESIPNHSGVPHSVTGRFAPSPTGPLHFGSLVAALGSCLEARRHQGRWLVRMEDVDTPRCIPGMAEDIVRDLERLGFQWDGEIVLQSRRLDLYAAALERLRRSEQVFACGCSRREMADSGLARDGSRRYPGTCRNGLAEGREGRAWRFLAPEGELTWYDAVQGAQSEDVACDVGDFVLLRADGLFAYQLAVVVDDADQGVNQVVRGADLLDSTGRQIALQCALGLPAPRYAHLPVATNAAGEKLSKQTLASPIHDIPAAQALCGALRFLGQPVPDGLVSAGVQDVWQWALQYWNIDRVPKRRAIIHTN